MTSDLYVDPAHRVPDSRWGEVVREAEAALARHLANPTGGAASPAGPIINMLGSGKHSGVSGIPTQLLVLHSGECPLRGGYAQALTSWGNTPAELGGPIASWHWFIDPIARVRMIEEVYAAWHASEANPISEGFEQAGYARYSRGEWTTPDGLLQMESLAYTMAERAKANGIPARWLTTAEVTRATSGDRSIKGLCLHRQIDPETRTDPGDGYPYDMLLTKIKAYMGQTTTTATKELFTMGQYEDLMAGIADVKKIAANTHAGVWLGGTNVDGQKFNYGVLPIVAHSQQLMAQQNTELQAQVKGLVGAVAALSKGEAFDQEKLLTGIQAAAETGAQAGALKALEGGTVAVDISVIGPGAEAGPRA